ncbi:MAG: hypothetical protein R2759_13385 [Bacteroidales bacterium]
MHSDLRDNLNALKYKNFDPQKPYEQTKLNFSRTFMMLKNIINRTNTGSLNTGKHGLNEIKNFSANAGQVTSKLKNKNRQKFDH